MVVCGSSYTKIAQALIVVFLFDMQKKIRNTGKYLLTFFSSLGLATEGNLYQKLLGVIHEIGYELGQCVQNNEVARERLMTSKFDLFVRYSL